MNEFNLYPNKGDEEESKMIIFFWVLMKFLSLFFDSHLKIESIYIKQITLSFF